MKDSVSKISVTNQKSPASFNIVDFVNYQEDSVVSREIISKSTGTVTFFAFDKGQGLSEHKTPYNGLVLVVDGEAVITISGKEHRFKKGEMIIMPANKPHSVKSVTRFKMILIMIRG